MVDDIKPISVDTKQGPVKERPTRPWVKPVVIGAGTVALLLVAFFVYLGVSLLPLKTVYDTSPAAMAKARELADAIKGQDLDLAKAKVQETKTEFLALKTEYEKVRAVAWVPFVGSYINDGFRAFAAGEAGIAALENGIAALEPNADLLGLKGESKFVSGSADERIQTAVKTMVALTPKVQEIAVNLDTLQKEIDAIDENRYPESFRGVAVRSRLKEFKETVNNAAGLFVNAQPLLMKIPSILGEPDTKRYLVLFQNDKELRPTGGFLTAYAQFRLERGKIILEGSDDIYELDASMTRKFPVPKEITTYHKGVYEFHLRDSNLSPDFKESMEQFMKMYETTTRREKIDGIIAVDTHVLVEALRILGPMTIEGRVFSAEIDKRCDCPRAVYELEDYATRPVNYVRTDRKDIIGVLLQQLMSKALGVSPSQYWGQLFQMLIAEINQKHVLAYFMDGETQAAGENFNMAGRIMTASESAKLLKYDESPAWDYLHVNNANMAGAKSNMFVNESFTKDTTVNGDGTVTTKLTIEYKNPYQGSDCGLESGGLCLNAPLRNWLRIYVPKGSVLKESKGTQSPKDASATPLIVSESLGKTVFEGFLIVNPMGTARVDVTYTSPVVPDGKYRLLVQKQPGTSGQEFVLRLGGKEKATITLDSDREFVY